VRWRPSEVGGIHGMPKEEDDHASSGGAQADTADAFLGLLSGWPPLFDQGWLTMGPFGGPCWDPMVEEVVLTSQARTRGRVLAGSVSVDLASGPMEEVAATPELPHGEEW
jgi:hypothetical protein